VCGQLGKRQKKSDSRLDNLLDSACRPINKRQKEKELMGGMLLRDCQSGGWALAYWLVVDGHLFVFVFVWPVQELPACG
jgi:hypothetical protein